MGWFTDLTPEIQKMLIITVISLIGAVIFIIALKNGWIKNFRASFKDGFNLESKANDDKKENSGGGSEDKISDINLEKAITEINIKFRQKCRNLVIDMRSRFINDLYNFSTCDLAKSTLASTLYFPLLSAIEENHFRRKFSPQNIDNSLNTLLLEIEIEYQKYYSIAKDACENSNIPAFADIRDFLYKLLKNQWSQKIKEFIVYTSEDKVEVYNDYLTHFTAIGDKHNIDKCGECISKNKKYIEEFRNV